MRAFLATVLSVIAVGVVLIAYGLLVPRAPASGLYPSDSARPVFAGQQIGYVDDLRDPRAVRANEVFVTQAPRPTAPAPVRYETAPVRSRRPATRRVERSSGRDWAKTAMVIGGSTAAGAGLGAIFGGKKGALIGAALGGGAGTIYEGKKR